MSCVLRAWGKTFDVEGYLKNSKLKPCAVWKKGQKFRRVIKGKKSFLDSGFNCEVSNKDFDARKQQIEDAIKFLTRHKRLVKRLVGFPGVDIVSLSFGFRNRPLNGDSYVEGLTLPEKLVAIAGSIGLEIDLALYPCSD